MRTLKALSIAVIVWALAVTLPAYSQQEETRPAQGQEEKAKDKDKNKADRQEDKVKQEDHPGMKQGEERQEQKGQRQDQRQDQKMERNEHQHPMGAGQKGKKIPDEKFRSSFGRQHTFKVQRTQVINVAQPTVVYGGYTFQLVEAWPTVWGFGDPVYIDYDPAADEYFMFDVLHPEVRVAVFVVE